MLNCIIIACSAFQRLSYNPSPYIGLVRGMQLCCAIVSHQYWILAQNSLVKFSTDLEAIVSCRPALPGSSSIWADWKPCCRIASAVAAEGSRQSSRPMCSAASPCRSACDHDFDLIQKKNVKLSPTQPLSEDQFANHAFWLSWLCTRNANEYRRRRKTVTRPLEQGVRAMVEHGRPTDALARAATKSIRRR